MKKRKKRVAVRPSPINEKKRIPLRITDTTLRDAHQSLWATRMRTSDILGIVDVIDNAGFYSLEVWGGATFDVCLRFLREDPWERLREIKARARNTPLQMLLRGQNVVGYKNYPDDVLDRFVALAVKNGMDIFRIFDALNDTRNLESAIKAVKRHGGHAQGTICYTISPVHTVEKFVRYATEQVAIGIDSLCIKDMAGLLSPIQAEKLVSALVREIKVPIQMHCHATSGMAVSSYVEGVRAGAGAIDCAISSMAGFSSQPPVETMISIFDEMPYHANIDLQALRKICKYFEDLAPKRSLDMAPQSFIDPEVLLHHIPGGMISNLRSQLAQQGALDKLGEVLKELPRCRAELGYPPLVTPTSQIVGVQAVMNVLSGDRYSMVPEETRNYVKGLYGQAPGKVNPEIKRKIMGGDKVLTCRPADLLPPMLPTATNGIEDGLIQNEEDIISYCMFPEVALGFFKWRKTPVDQRTKIPADEEQEKKNAKLQGAAPVLPPSSVPETHSMLAANEYKEIHSLIEKINELGLTEVTIRRGDVSLSMKGSNGGGTTAPSVSAAPKKEHKVEAKSSAPAAGPAKPVAAAAAAVSGPTINAPLNGTFYMTAGPGKPEFVKEGDSVDADATVCIVEAMKMFNQIKAPYACKVVKVLVEHGKPVQKGQPLVQVEKK